LIELFCGDCLEIMDELISQNTKVDVIICDPPFGSTKCKWDYVIPFDKMWDRIKKIRKSNSPTVLFGTEPFSSLLRVSNLKEFKYDWVWDKVTARGHLVAKKRPMQQTEIISVFGKGRINYYPIMIDRPLDKIEFRRTTEYKRTEIMGGSKNAPKNKIYDKWYPKNLITFSNAGSSVKSLHPTQKPVELMEYLVKTYTMEGDIVLDPFCAIGTTLGVADALKRHWIGIERDKFAFMMASLYLDGLAFEKVNAIS